MAKGCTNNKYEEARKQRLEENKKRFEDLGISRISKKLNEHASAAKKSPHRSPKPKAKTNEVAEPRRSSRVRNHVPSYREDIGMELPLLRRRRSRSTPPSWGSYVARPLDEIKEATHEERIRALEAAEALQNNLQSANPSFVKSMVRSHVYSCFWLGLPARFCEKHLPKAVHNMVLEDESGSEYEAVYLGNRAGLSGGWRAFALEHKLDDGDALVFELVEAARFKVYIVRAFLDSTDEDEKQFSEKEEKADNNHEAESNTKKKRKLTIADETIELASFEDHVSKSSIDKEVKSKEVIPTKRTKVSQKKLQKKSLEKAQVEAEKPKAARKPKTRANNAKESEENIVQENGDSSKKNGIVKEAEKPKAARKPKTRANNAKESEENGDSSKKNGIVKDAGRDLKEVEPVEGGSKSVSRRKKPAPKLFRKKRA